MRPYLGGGGGMYVWSVQSKDLGAAKDPITFERLPYPIATIQARMRRLGIDPATLLERERA